MPQWLRTSQCIPALLFDFGYSMSTHFCMAECSASNCMLHKIMHNALHNFLKVFKKDNLSQNTWRKKRHGIAQRLINNCIEWTVWNECVCITSAQKFPQRNFDISSSIHTCCFKFGRSRSHCIADLFFLDENVGNVRPRIQHKTWVQQVLRNCYMIHP